MTTKNIDDLAKFIISYKTKVDIVINEFGDIQSSNGYGTTFLYPKSEFFKTFWIFEENKEVKSVGFGGADLGVKLSDFVNNWPFQKEVYSRYDDLYNYIFYDDKKDGRYTIKIDSKEKLFEDGIMIRDVSINGIELTFY